MYIIHIQCILYIHIHITLYSVNFVEELAEINLINCELEEGLHPSLWWPHPPNKTARVLSETLLKYAFLSQSQFSFLYEQSTRWWSEGSNQHDPNKQLNIVCNQITSCNEVSARPLSFCAPSIQLLQCVGSIVVWTKVKTPLFLPLLHLQLALDGVKSVASLVSIGISCDAICDWLRSI